MPLSQCSNDSDQPRLERCECSADQFDYDTLNLNSSSSECYNECIYAVPDSDQPRNRFHSPKKKMHSSRK